MLSFPLALPPGCVEMYNMCTVYCCTLGQIISGNIPVWAAAPQRDPPLSHVTVFVALIVLQFVKLIVGLFPH